MEGFAAMSGDKPVISPRPFSPAPLLLSLGVWGFLCRGISALLAPSCVSAEEPDLRAITEKPGSLMCGADIFSSVGEPAFFPGVSLAAAQEMGFSAGISWAHSHSGSETWQRSGQQ